MEHAVELVLPAHNEAASIRSTLEEIHATAAADGVAVSFVVTEDGSTDGTADVVRDAAAALPVKLLSDPVRKGYSRAVLDGLRETTADVIGFVDSDGQCDPADLRTLLDRLEGVDMVVGYRSPRADTGFRRAISRAFGIVYSRLFPVRLRDPSCPFIVLRRAALEPVLRGNPGILRQGFWWEFNARAAAAGLRVVEVPVRHRTRAAGTTQVYTPRKLPRIAIEHLRGLVTLRRELRQVHPAWRTIPSTGGQSGT